MDLATEIPGASEFRFEWSPVWYAIGVLGVLFFSVIFPKTLSFIAEGPDGKIQHAYWIRGIGIVAAFLGVFGFLSFIFDLVRSVSIVVGGILLLSIILYILG